MAPTLCAWCGGDGGVEGRGEEVETEMAGREPEGGKRSAQVVQQKGGRGRHRRCSKDQISARGVSSAGRSGGTRGQ